MKLLELLKLDLQFNNFKSYKKTIGPALKDNFKRMITNQ